MPRTLLLRETQNSNQLHMVLREKLRESLISQPPGKRVSSERVLAKEFGVSTATVSRALQELQQEGILLRIPGKGTYLALSDGDQNGELPDNGAHPLFHETNNDLRRAGSIGLSAPAFASPLAFASPTEEKRDVQDVKLNAWIVVQLEPYETSVDRTSEFWPQRIVSRLEYLINGQGGKTKITVGHALTEQECVEACQEAVNENVNCVFFIVADRNPLVDVWVEQFIRNQIGSENARQLQQPPVTVQVSLSATQHAYFDTVSFDGEWGSYLATAHLLNLGHRNIAFLAPAANLAWLDQRILGFHRALRGFGIAVPREQNDFGVIRVEELPNGPYMWQQLGENSVERVLGDSSITAVVAANDQMASAFIERARSLGKAIPESLSVVGYDDWFTSAMHGLTTVHPPIDEIADAALQMAKNQRQPTEVPQHAHLFLKPTLMVRRSTQAPTMIAPTMQSQTLESNHSKRIAGKNGG